MTETERKTARDTIAESFDRAWRNEYYPRIGLAGYQLKAFASRVEKDLRQAGLLVGEPSEEQRLVFARAIFNENRPNNVSEAEYNEGWRSKREVYLALTKAGFDALTAAHLPSLAVTSPHSPSVSVTESVTPQEPSEPAEAVRVIACTGTESYAEAFNAGWDQAVKQGVAQREPNADSALRHIRAVYDAGVHGGDEETYYITPEGTLDGIREVLEGVEVGATPAPSPDREKQRVEAANQVAGIVFDEIKRVWPDLHPLLDLRYGIAHKVLDALPALASPVEVEVDEAQGSPFTLTDNEWRAYQAIPGQGYSHRHYIEQIVNSRLRGDRSE